MEIITPRPKELWDRPRRFAYPHQGVADAKIEPIVQPLYSAAVYDNASMNGQRELFFFRYAVGGQVAGLAAATGTVAATQLHTNMTQPNLLAVPKVMLVHGVRVVVVGLDSSLTTVLDDSGTITEVPDQSAQIQDLQRILYGTWFRFFVGVKNYITVPTYATPGNVGIGGVGDTALSVAAASGPNQAQLNAASGGGRRFQIGNSRGGHPILIPSQQNFFCSLNATQAVSPTIATERLVYVFLDGIFGREVM